MTIPSIIYGNKADRDWPSAWLDFRSGVWVIDGEDKTASTEIIGTVHPNVKEGKDPIALIEWAKSRFGRVYLSSAVRVRLAAQEVNLTSVIGESHMSAAKLTDRIRIFTEKGMSVGARLWGWKQRKDKNAAPPVAPGKEDMDLGEGQGSIPGKEGKSKKKVGEKGALDLVHEKPGTFRDRLAALKSGKVQESKGPLKEGMYSNALGTPDEDDRARESYLYIPITAENKDDVIAKFRELGGKNSPTSSSTWKNSNGAVQPQSLYVRFPTVEKARAFEKWYNDKAYVTDDDIELWVLSESKTVGLLSRIGEAVGGQSSGSPLRQRQMPVFLR